VNTLIFKCGFLIDSAVYFLEHAWFSFSDCVGGFCFSFLPVDDYLNSLLSSALSLLRWEGFSSCEGGEEREED